MYSLPIILKSYQIQFEIGIISKEIFIDDMDKMILNSLTIDPIVLELSLCKSKSIKTILGLINDYLNDIVFLPNEMEKHEIENSVIKVLKLQYENCIINKLDLAKYLYKLSLYFMSSILMQVEEYIDDNIKDTDELIIEIFNRVL